MKQDCNRILDRHPLQTAPISDATHSDATEIQCSRFTTPTGLDEVSLMISDHKTLDTEAACASLLAKYTHTRDEQDLAPDSLQFSRIYLSDMANQREAVLDSELYRTLRQGAVSIMEQRPLEGGAISVHTTHIQPKESPLTHPSRPVDPQGWRNESLTCGENYQWLWSANYDGRGPFNAYDQTNELFDSLQSDLGAHGLLLNQHTVRTWIYVRDIDNHYMGMVRARLGLFERIGLTDKTRYLASTGIEGKARNVDTLATLDALSIGGLKEEQLVRMDAPSHMSPTIDYGVTFERGTRVRFGDRSHLYISGTASIDTAGEVMYLGDAQRQTERALENIDALLKPQGATLSDMAYLYVYVRNPASFDTIRAVVNQTVPQHVPVLFLDGSVCRPEWLVEIEGVGLIPDDAPFPAFR